MKLYIENLIIVQDQLIQTKAGLSVHELIKCSIQEGSELDPKEVCNQLAETLHAEFVQAIGRRFVLYRRAKDPEKREIVLPR